MLQQAAFCSRKRRLPGRQGQATNPQHTTRQQQQQYKPVSLMPCAASPGFLHTLHPHQCLAVVPLLTQSVPPLLALWLAVPACLMCLPCLPHLLLSCTHCIHMSAHRRRPCLPFICCLLHNIPNDMCLPCLPFICCCLHNRLHDQHPHAGVGCQAHWPRVRPAHGCRPRHDMDEHGPCTCTPGALQHNKGWGQAAGSLGPAAVATG